LTLPVAESPQLVRVLVASIYAEGVGERFEGVCCYFLVTVSQPTIERCKSGLTVLFESFPGEREIFSNLV
jgi:hypothetical protein